jgi:hypothetical protein
MVELVGVEHRHDVNSRVPQRSTLELAQHVAIARARLAVDRLGTGELVTVHAEPRCDA